MHKKTACWILKWAVQGSGVMAMLLLWSVGSSLLSPEGCGRLTPCAMSQSTSPEPGHTSTTPTLPPDAAPPSDTPLRRLHPSPLSAYQLQQGDVLLNFRGLLYDSSGSVETSGITLFYDAGFSWGITDNFELSMQFQHVDSNYPGRQGPFTAVLTADNESTAALRYTLWHNAARTLQLGSTVSLSGGNRSVRFRTQGAVIDRENQTLVPTLQLPFSALLGGNLSMTLAPILAVFPGRHAMYLFRPPLPDADTFGPLFGFSGALSYAVHPRLVLWGDLFVPVLGNNSIARNSGQPDTSLAFNAGGRYLLTPRLAVDVFASNTLGNLGALAFLADQDKVGAGVNVVFLPDVFPANQRYEERFGDAPLSLAMTDDGIAFFDGGTLPAGYFLITLQGGTQGILSAVHFSPTANLELALYLDYITSNIDESEQGFALKLRLLNQAEANPFTASVAVTVGLTNRVFLNFFHDDRNAFAQSGLERNVPFLLKGDDGPEGELFLMTFSLPLHYQLDNGLAFWATPTIGVVQRRGVEIAGVNVGGAIPLFHQVLSLLAEVGGNFAGNGNAFLDDHLENAVPWAAALRLHFDHLRRRSQFRDTPGASLELFVTNRVGSSPFHSLRVREDGDIAFGAGLSIPFHF